MDATPDIYGPNGVNYTNTSPDQDLARIGIDITERSAEEKKCMAGDWALVHWHGYLKDGREVTNSHVEAGGHPKMFSLGHHDVFACWDYAIQQLHKGDKARLSCPAYYVWGGAYTIAPLGGEPIPLHSDVDFDIEVIDCNRVPKIPDYSEEPHTTTMQPGRCMYFHSVASQEEGTPLVIDCENEDRVNSYWFSYYPAVNCYLEEWVKETKSQEFFWHEDTKAIHDGDKNWELCYQSGALALCDFSRYSYGYTSWYFWHYHMVWHYDGVTQTLQHNFWWGSIFPYVYHTAKWSYIYFDWMWGHDVEQLENVNAKFRIEYCWKNF